GRVPRGDSSTGAALSPTPGDPRRPPELHGELSILAHRSDGVRETGCCHGDSGHDEHGRGRRLGPPRAAGGCDGPGRRDRSLARRRRVAEAARTNGGDRRPRSIFLGADVQRDAPIFRACARGFVTRGESGWSWEGGRGWRKGVALAA